jgi:hypothetical protein
VSGCDRIVYMTERVDTLIKRAGIVLCCVLVLGFTARAADVPHTLLEELSVASEVRTRGTAADALALKTGQRPPCEPPISSVALTTAPKRCARKGCTCRCKKVNACCC